MYYLFKYLLKFLILFFICSIFSIFAFYEIIFFFSQKRTNFFWIFINTIYYNIEENDNYKRKLAKDKTLIDWVLDYKNQYNLFKINRDSDDDLWYY